MRGAAPRNAPPSYLPGNDQQYGWGLHQGPPRDGQAFFI